jgi:hypothetical protein
MTFSTNFGEENGEYIAIRTTTALLNCNGERRRVVIAMDPCSNSTNIDEDFARELQLKVEDTGIVRNINFLEGSSRIESNIVSFMLSPLDSETMYPVKAYTVKNLISGTPVVDWTQVAEDFPYLKQAKIPKPLKSDRVHILLGTDFAYLNGSSQGIFGKEFEPIAELTKLGWAFSGRIKSDQILQSWQTQFGNAGRHSSFSFMAKEDSVAPCAKSKGSLPVIIEETSEKFEGRVSQPSICESKEIETQTDPIPETEIVHSSLMEESVVVTRTKIVGSNNTIRDTITSADLDLALISSMDPNPGLFTYLNIAPNLDEQEKLIELDELMKKSWELESLGLVEKIPRFSNDLKASSITKWSKSEQLAVDKMNVTYLKELKQFQISIPWKDDPPKFLKSNRAEVKARQDGVCHRLGDKIGAAQKIFDGYLEKGYVRKLEKHEIYEQNVFYLPFFTVVKEDSTTPVRIVWDCAAKYFGRSLNSEIMQTPNCLQNLFTVLLRVRKFKFVVMSDISEMFLKVRLDPKDRRYHRFVFNGEDYEWQVMLFGNRSSPDGSQLAIRANCDLHGKDFPEAVETVMNSCYMDNGADS